MKTILISRTDKDNDKKYMAVLLKNGKLKEVYFGQKGASDYLKHKDKERRDNYIARHKNEKKFWKFEEDNYIRPAFYSRWFSWNKPTINKAVRFMNNEAKNVKFIYI